MATGQSMLELASQHIGEDYENVQVPKVNANWQGRRIAEKLTVDQGLRFAHLNL